MNIWIRLRQWFWWKFQATEQDKMEWDLMAYGQAIIDSKGKRVDPRTFTPPEKVFVNPFAPHLSELLDSIKLDTNHIELVPKSPRPKREVKKRND